MGHVLEKEVHSHRTLHTEAAHCECANGHRLEGGRGEASVVFKGWDGLTVRMSGSGVRRPKLSAAWLGVRVGGSCLPGESR